MVVNYEEIIRRLTSESEPDTAAGMARFGIHSEHTYGVSIPRLRKIAREAGKDHDLAQQLWSSGIHEARILASMVDVPQRVAEKQMDAWAKDFDSWAVCDQCCNNLFYKTKIAYKKAFQWTGRKEKFVKRAGFTLMAVLAAHDKTASNKEFIKFFPLIIRESVDNRNFVKKAVNRALRQIGKRDPVLKRAAIKTAKGIHAIDSKSARWIASDAIRELTRKTQ